MDFGELRKTSATVDGTLSEGVFDLDVLYSIVKIDEDVYEVKYDGKKKTKQGEEVCKTFSNQVTFKMTGGIIIKLFRTKKFAVSGAGTVDTALDNSRIAIEKLLKKIDTIKQTKKINIESKRGFYVFYGNRIVTMENGEYVCKNTVKDDSIAINCNKCVEFDKIDGVYVDIKHKDRKKTLYNNLAKEIGYIEYSMIRNTKSLRIKDCTYDLIEPMKYSIKNSYGNILGTMVIHLRGDPTPVKLSEYIDLTMAVSDSKSSITSIRFSNCNYDMKLKKPTNINREQICSYLQQHGIIYTYDPSSYPGVKFSISDVKITIFRTGSVLFSSKCDVTKEAYPFVTKMFETDFSYIKQEDVSSDDTSLTIWDI
jgi:TATA-box binding protein (TBP) (component of TFIID and TFIIIB)